MPSVLDTRCPPNAKFVIEDEQQFPGLQSGVPLSPGACADHAAALAAVCAEPDGLLLPAQLDADADDGGQAAADDRGARRRELAGRRHGRGAFALLVAATAPIPRHRDHVRDCRASGRFDRLCRPDVPGRVADRDFLCRLPGAGHPVRHQCRRRADLSDLAARQWLGMAIGHRTHRINRRPVGRGVVRRHAGAATLYVVGAAVRAPARLSASRCIGSIPRVSQRIRNWSRQQQAPCVASKRLVAAQGGNDFLAEQADRAHQVGLGQVREIELAHEDVEQAGLAAAREFSLATVSGEPMKTSSCFIR